MDSNLISAKRPYLDWNSWMVLETSLAACNSNISGATVGRGAEPSKAAKNGNQQLNMLQQMQLRTQSYFVGLKAALKNENMLLNLCYSTRDSFPKPERRGGYSLVPPGYQLMETGSTPD